ncbi:hypothetical protein VNO77_18325 [Canavalia gladiata]|uniref:Uncharacterized protein n=1 Tax=Canavalia gladiata TaxID=3824 RepID=A0AAN9LKL4_CANGL
MRTAADVLGFGFEVLYGGFQNYIRGHWSEWTSHPQYIVEQFIINACKGKGRDLTAKRKDGRNKSINFTEEIFNNIHRRKILLEARIEGVQRALEIYPSSGLIMFEKSLQREYNMALLLLVTDDEVFSALSKMRCFKASEVDGFEVIFVGKEVCLMVWSTLTIDGHKGYSPGIPTIGKTSTFSGIESIQIQLHFIVFGERVMVLNQHWQYTNYVDLASKLKDLEWKDSDVRRTRSYFMPQGKETRGDQCPSHCHMAARKNSMASQNIKSAITRQPG